MSHTVESAVTDKQPVNLISYITIIIDSDDFEAVDTAVIHDWMLASHLWVIKLSADYWLRCLFEIMNKRQKS